jgi:hypothetical protein
MEYKRQEHELPLATKKWSRKYHHLGIPVKDPIPGEKHIPHLKLYVNPDIYRDDTSPFGIELMRFEDDCPFDDIIKTMPHIAFEVRDLEEAIKGFELLGEPNCPMEGVKVAMIKHNENIMVFQLSLWK